MKSRMEIIRELLEPSMAGDVAEILEVLKHAAERSAKLKESTRNLAGVKELARSIHRSVDEARTAVSRYADQIHDRLEAPAGADPESRVEFVDGELAEAVTASRNGDGNGSSS